ncbi:hypothetical protein B9Z55_012253 [Caenorhabditis nigoni]|uniref:F-box domain-containing protein n=1 Tax=Caenorhabditis nigoni TaxID=1611254 RepID=A0A2G5TWB9_9PELO|nr:hypothetical protein B9Z55_012253 [Caenorhabditis nigoni]
MPFPILRTPFVVLSEIISILEPNEAVTSSFCSKNFKCLLSNQYRHRKKFVMLEAYMVDFEDDIRVAIAPGMEETKIVLSVVPMSKLNESTNKVVEINGHKAEFSSEVPIFYFEDKKLGSQWIVDYVTGLFNIDVRRLAIGRNSTWAVDWINSRQEKSMNRVLLVEPTNNDSKADEAVDYVLKNARSSDWIGIDEYVSDNYRFNGTLGPVQEVSISEKGYWVTCDNLMNFDAIEIYIGNSRLTISDLNPFLRHWRAGGSPRLEYLEVCLENGTIFENFDDDLEVVRTDEVGTYPVSFGDPVVIHNCYSIQRMDGVKALFICDRYFHFIVQHGKATSWRE